MEDVNCDMTYATARQTPPARRTKNKQHQY